MQHERFDAWQQEYNDFRPHESLGQRRPGEVYKTTVPHNPAPVEFNYPPEYEQRKINKDGMLRWEGRDYFVSEVFIGEKVGLRRCGVEEFEVFAGSMYLGALAPGHLDALKLTRASSKVLPMSSDRV